MRFEFATATRIVFGAGTLQETDAIARSFGRRALLVTGSQPQRAERLISLLQTAQVEAIPFPVSQEPEIGTVEEGVKHARANHCDQVISFGGGSVIDAGKAIAAMLTNPGEVLDYLEVVGRNQPLKQPPAPFLAIPTTAGTGTEVTRNAVLASPAHRVKVSLRSPLMLPRVALVDPELTAAPPAVTAASGLDALTQVIEPYVSCRANPMTDALCVEGMKRAARSLRRVFDRSTDSAAREDMAITSLFSGMALANAGLGAVHGFASPIGGMFPAPHGAVCAALLPHVMATNVRALQERQTDSPVARRFDEVARLLTGSATATADDGVRWIESLVRDLQIPGLGRYGLAPSHADDLVQKATAASSMKGNPLPLTADELKAILLAAL